MAKKYIKRWKDQAPLEPRFDGNYIDTVRSESYPFGFSGMPKNAGFGDFNNPGLGGFLEDFNEA